MAMIAESPGQIYTIASAPATIAKGIIVKSTGELAGTGVNALGVVLTAADQYGELAVAISGIVKVTSGAALSANMALQSNTAGKAIELVSGNQPFGIAQETVSAADTSLLVKLI